MDQPVSRQTKLSLIDRLKADDGQTLKALYAANYNTLMHFVLKNNGLEEDAKDIYQEAFLAVWRNVQLERFLPANDSEFGAYLVRVAKNKWIDQLRKQKNRYVVSLDDEHIEHTLAADPAHQPDMYINTVKEQYGRLGARCKELLGRFYFRRQSLREIAEVFDWTEASAKNNKYRCLKQLRELVIKGGTD